MGGNASFRPLIRNGLWEKAFYFELLKLEELTMSENFLSQAFNNEEEKEVPISFWHHFAPNEFVSAKEHPEVVDQNLNGLKKYVQDVNPDFIKLMTDGFFLYDFQDVENVQDADSLQKIKPLSHDNWWFRGQAELVKKQRNVVGKKLAFYNIFSPVTILKWALVDQTKEPVTLADKRFADLYEDHPQLVKKVLDVIAQDVIEQVNIVLKSGADGVYYSTQTIQDDRLFNKEFFDSVHKPVDLKVIDGINKLSQKNILHICGFDGAKNDLAWFKDYPLQIINWSCHTDGYSLGEGKKLFGGKPVLGGFGITKKDLLYSGSKQEIQNEVHRLIDEAGTKGVILGADCTIFRDTPIDHIKWAKQAAHDYTNEVI